MTTRKTMEEWGADRLKLAAAEARVRELEEQVRQLGECETDLQKDHDIICNRLDAMCPRNLHSYPHDQLDWIEKRVQELEAALASIRKYLYDHEDVEDDTTPGRVLPNWAMRMVQDCAQEFKALKGGA